jgi:hypothetical protein
MAQANVSLSQTTNQFRHAFPHAKLYNVTLTPISRLTRGNSWLSRHMIENDDLRNFAISRADDVAKAFGWRA